MPVFIYKAIDKFGKEITSEIDVASYDEAIKKIRSLGYLPIKIRAKRERKRTGPVIAPTTIKQPVSKRLVIPILGIGAVKSQQITIFARQLATLLSAGLPLVRSLNVLRDQIRQSAFRDVLDGLSQYVETGSNFSDALSKYPRVFSSLFVNTIKAGEAGGVLEIVLTRLADFREKAERLRSKIQTALIYPLLVVAVAISVLTFLIIFVVPRFMSLYEEIGTELPIATLVLLQISRLFQKRWILMVIAVGCAVMIYNILIKIHAVKYYLDKLRLRLPIFGMLIQKISITRFSRTLGTLIASGVPILQALIITKDTAGNEVIARAIEKVHNSIREGESIAVPLAKTRIFPSMVVNMINVGEETGSIEQMLNKIADTYEDEVDATVGALTSLLEPVLIVIMGIIVGSIVIAMFLPLVKLLTTLSA